MMDNYKSVSKTKRQQLILKAIRDEFVTTQKQLVAALKRLGLDITQASVSRDVSEMGLVKVAGRYQTGQPGAGAADPDLVFRLWVREVKPAGANLVVLKGGPGTAQRIALTLDQRDLKEVVGTVAGDDTVFVAVPNQAACRRFVRFVRNSIKSESE